MIITRKTVLIGILATTILAATAVTVTLVVLDDDETINYREHDPIVIWGDNDFNIYNFPGEGTEKSPYKISRYNITTDSDFGIVIWNTTMHFIIEKCLINANETGIYIESVAPGTAFIQNNKCIMNFYDGIFVYDFPQTTLLQNTCTNNGGGIFIHSSMGCTLEKNTCTNNGDGIIIYHSPLSSLTNCKIANNGIGAYIGYSISISVVNCEISNNGEGISIEESATFSLKDSEINNNGYGIIIRTSDSSNIEDNYIHNNGLGAYFIDISFTNFENNILTYNANAMLFDSNVNESLITYNYFEKNYVYTIYIELFNYNNVIHHNTFFNNSGEATSQAYDNGFTTWYDVDTNEGNWYDDWIGTGSYSIDGIMGNEDPYPLESRPV